MSVSLKPYIGSRDFFPEDMDFRNWMFQVLRDACVSYGYSEYNAPLLESIELYRMKSSEEIVNEQLYRFIDRGEREVAIRPEMTPTLARMVASRLKETPRPFRWFSIANFMRYERPGRGRLREFYQLNVDYLGSGGPAADAELLMLSMDILRAFGAGPEHFSVHYGHRRLLESYLGDMPEEKKRSVIRLLDKKEKLKPEEFDALLSQEIPDAGEARRIAAYLEITGEDLPGLAEKGELDGEATEELILIRKILDEQGYGEYLRFDPGIMRGFDYYTGFIFEIFDADPENRRSIFGGGRYDKLIGLFAKENVPAVGFGLGDVTLRNFIEAHKLTSSLPEERRGIYLTLFNKDLLAENLKLASELRKAGLETEVALEPTKKLGRQFELADKKRRRLALVMGPEEAKNGVLRIKDLVSGEQSDAERKDVVSVLTEMLGAS